MSKQLSIFERYPESPGYKDDDTSRQAAREIAPEVVTLRDLVLTELRRRSGTADEIAERLYKTPFAIRPRLTELCRIGFVEKTLLKAKNRSGKWARVWRVKSGK